MSVMIHPTAEVQTADIGDGTRVWQHTVILKGAKIGRNCNICANCFIEGQVTIGDNVTVKPYVGICDGVTIEDGAFLGPNVAFANDRSPKSGNAAEYVMERIHIGKGAAIGVGAILMPSVKIGDGALVGAGSVVTKDVPPGATVVGNPAREIERKG